MSPRFTVIEKVSPLEQNAYTFGVRDNLKVFLSSFEKQTRESPRHKFKVTEWYDRVFQRDSTIKAPPPIPHAVLHNVLQDIQNSITYEE